MGLIDSYDFGGDGGVAAKSFNPLQWGLLILTSSRSYSISRYLVSIPFNGAYWFLQNQSATTHQSMVLFQSPSMGLIDSYTIWTSSTETCTGSFNPLQWGLLILTALRPKSWSLDRPCFNPLQWGLLILTRCRLAILTWISTVSIPFNGAYWFLHPCENRLECWYVFQSPSMGLIDSYSRSYICLNLVFRFNPLQWGLLILTGGRSPLWGRMSSFNPLQWGLLILTSLLLRRKPDSDCFNPLQWGLLILTNRHCI